MAFTKSDYNSSNKTNPKRIASNALVLFARIFIITVINLYAVRYVISGLGIEDYGIYNAIAGVIMTSSCLTPVIALSLQRFYSYAMGRNEYDRLSELFSAGVNISFVFSVLIIIIFETIGLWFVNTQLTIPTDRIAEVGWVFHLSLLSFIFSIMQVPYTAAVFSHEQMGIYAAISTLECLAKFVIAIMISYTTTGHLIFYCSGLLFVSATVFITYVVIARHRYKECRYVYVKDQSLYKELLSFSGWTFYGAIASVGMIQGSTILLNIFFGPIANAAFGISVNIYNAFMSLSNSIVLAFRPSMVKTYAENKKELLEQLFFICNKAIFLLLSCVAIPIIFEIDTILKWWLDIIPQNTQLYVCLFIIFCICLALHNPISIIVQAIGRIRNYHLMVETMMVACVPITWIVFYLNYPSYSVFIVMISLCVVAHFIRILYLKNNHKSFSINKYLVRFVIPCSSIAMLNVLITWWVHTLIADPFLRLLSVCVTSCSISVMLTYLIGTTKKEKAYIRNKIHI